jgi:hypothetical protein
MRRRRPDPQGGTNPEGVFFKLGLIGESEVLLAGPSNAGLTDPGHASALSLMQISPDRR